MRRLLWLLLPALLGCQSERWQLPAALGGSPDRRYNYTELGDEPPRLLFLQSIGHADTSGCIQPPLPLSSRLVILPTAGGSLVAVAAAETLWSFSFPRGVTVASALCADTATLYALGSDGVLYALSFQGRLRWQKKLFRGIAEGGGPYTNPLPLRDGLLVGETSGQLLRLSSQGELLWRHDRGARLDRNPVRDARGNVLLGILSGESTAADTLVLLDSAGHQRWARALPGTRLSCSPAAGNGLLVVAGVHSALDPIPVLHAFAETGEFLWSQRLPATARWISLDDSGTAYVVVQSTGIGEPISGILAYDRQGKSLWRQYLRTAIQTPALLFGKSLLVFATRGDGALGAYIFGRSDGELRDILSLEEAPPVLLQPAVTPDGSVVLGWSTRLGLVRLGEHPWRWLVF